MDLRTRPKTFSSFPNIGVVPNKQKREQVPVKAEIEKRRWCVICDDWVAPLSDGKGCPYCWCPTMSGAEKEKAES
jgi:hypothetical protein